MLDSDLNLWLIEVNNSPELVPSLGARQIAVPWMKPISPSAGNLFSFFASFPTRPTEAKEVQLFLLGKPSRASFFDPWKLKKPEALEVDQILPAVVGSQSGTRRGVGWKRGERVL